MFSCALSFNKYETGNDVIGGTYRYGHVFWTSSGNTVNFVIETAFKRSVNTSYFFGSAADGLAQAGSLLSILPLPFHIVVWFDRRRLIFVAEMMLQTGDVVTLFGREEPEFAFGDSMTARFLKMTVNPIHDPELLTVFVIVCEWIR